MLCLFLFVFVRLGDNFTKIDWIIAEQGGDHHRSGQLPQRSVSELRALGPWEVEIVDDFDWKMDEYEDFSDQKVKDEVLPKDEKQKIKEFLKEKDRERKRELKQVHKHPKYIYYIYKRSTYISILCFMKLLQAKEARNKAIDDMDPKEKEAFENIEFYKFYPMKTPDTPDVDSVKSKYINRYYRHTHYLM
uniref:Uncharacterized protein n=1 Tax=Setaria viridis TaxID=4556 RepID=A0A4U6UJ30_SETVI|nr:hypothetical protein SEVIR_5G186900v2 [Setaria viridis]